MISQLTRGVNGCRSSSTTPTAPGPRPPRRRSTGTTRTPTSKLSPPRPGTPATYGYTAYGTNDDEAFTGIDKPDTQDPGQEPYNVYRYNGKRWDPSSESYDMGFRDYSPGMNRFMSRDMYTGALADMNLGTDPFTGNRYAFTADNPISRVELDGHCFMDTRGNCTSTEDVESGNIDPPTTPPSRSSGGQNQTYGNGTDAVSTPEGCNSVVYCGADIHGPSVTHTQLDIAGLFPVVGTPADGVNCAKYAEEGDAANAAWSCAAAAPVFGIFVTLFKHAGKGVTNLFGKADKASESTDDLVAELGEQGVKHTPEDIVRAARDGTGKIVFLERGSSKAGLQYILKRHGSDSVNKGVSRQKIPDLIVNAATRGKAVGMQNTRPIYEVMFDGVSRRVAVTVGDNGYIVGANPVG